VVSSSVQSLSHGAPINECYKTAISAGVKPALAILGQALQKQNDLVGAAKYLQRAVKDQPTDPNLIKHDGEKNMVG